MPLSSRPVWPHCDSPAPAAVAGEKDACGVGFLAHVQGEASHWVLQQALRGLGCMEHRGGCGVVAVPGFVEPRAGPAPGGEGPVDPAATTAVVACAIPL